MILTDQLTQTWADIHLDEDIKHHIKQVINLSESNPESQYGLLKQARINGALLYGPPGTGKTQLARVLACEYKAVMIHVGPAEIEQKWLGETEKVIKAHFSLGTMLAPSIIFIDEADSIFCRRQSDDRNYVRNQISMLLSETDGLARAVQPPLLLLATNHPSDLDSAVLRRVPSRLYIGVPTAYGLGKMLEIFLREEDLEPGLWPKLKKMCGCMPWATGSDLRTLCVQAAMISQEQTLRGERRVLRWEHFEMAAKRCGPSVGSADLVKMKEFATDFDPAAVPKIKLRIQGEDDSAEELKPETRKHGDRWRAALKKKAREYDLAPGPSQRITRLDEPSYPYPRSSVNWKENKGKEKKKGKDQEEEISVSNEET